MFMFNLCLKSQAAGANENVSATDVIDKSKAVVYLQHSQDTRLSVTTLAQVTDIKAAQGYGVQLVEMTTRWS